MTFSKNNFFNCSNSDVDSSTYRNVLLHNLHIPPRETEVFFAFPGMTDEIFSATFSFISRLYDAIKFNKSSNLAMFPLNSLVATRSK